MKIFAKNAIIKKILIVLITIIMINSFIMPNYVRAASAPEKLVASFFYLLSYIGDGVISTMQEVMIGDGDIDSGGEYTIKYSPGMIFANEVAGLKVNFVSAKEEDRTTTTLTTDPDNKNELKDVIIRMNKKIKLSEREFVGKVTKSSSGEYVIQNNNGNVVNDIGMNVITGQNILKLEVPKDKPYIFTQYSTFPGWNGFWDKDVENILSKDEEFYLIWCYRDYMYIAALTGNVANSTVYSLTEGKEIYRCSLSKISNEYVTKESVAYELRDNISTWYSAFRTIALVGLLSVLVYIGIRIILSSTSSQDKAKYKNMLKDWLVAICILFILHYLMTFMMAFTDSLNGIIKDNIIQQNADGNNYDELISTVRNNYEIAPDSEEAPVWTTIGYAVMYLSLVILTLVFTIQYLKRVIFMAFLTMVAPMIALTYPLDKIKDSKAQAFSYWLREYIFNCLIQPVHLLIYAAFIHSVMGFAKENILYGIIALAFMVPAEKFIKEMFGLKSSSPTSQLGAAAGGALVMSMLNKMKGKPPKGDSESAGAGASSNPSGVRTATRNPSGSTAVTAPGTMPLTPTSPRTASATPVSGVPVSGVPASGAPASGAPASGAPASGVPASGAPAGGVPANGVPASGVPTSPVSTGSTQSSAGITGTTSTNANRNVAGGIGAVAKDFGRRYIYGPNALKSHAGRFTGILGGAAAATVGLAAQVADGDLFDNPQKALGDTAVAAAAGYMGGKNLAGNVIQGVNNIPKNIDKIKDVYDKGSLSEEAYQNLQFDKKVFASDGYRLIEHDESVKQFCSDRGISVKAATQEFLDNGITDTGKIREALQAGVTGDKYRLYSEAGLTDVNKIKELSRNGMPASEYKAYADLGVKDTQKALELARSGMSASYYKEYSNVGINDTQKALELAQSGISASNYKAYTDLGVKDTQKVLELAKSGVSARDYKAFADAGVSTPKEIVSFMQNGISADKLEEIKTYSGDTDMNKIKRYNTIAKAAKKENKHQNEDEFVAWAKLRMKDKKDDDLKRLYKKLNHYWS